jgi:hypothetical protein
MRATDFGASQNLRKFGNQITSRDPPRAFLAGEKEGELCM